VVRFTRHVQVVQETHFSKRWYSS